MRSKRNRKQIMNILFALLNILLLCDGIASAPNAIEEAQLSSNRAQQGNAKLLERVRRELGRYSATNTANGVTCTTQCRIMSGFSGRSQAEIDSIARDMTNQIVHDLRTGKIQRGEIKSQNWFENRVADKLTELEQQHRIEFDRNLHSVSNNFHSQQQQQQQQSNQFQQQSQSQQSYGYIQPITTGNSYQRIVEEHHKEVNRNTAYPTVVPINVYHGSTIVHRNNCTDQIHHGTYPYFNAQNQFNHRVESNRQQIHTAPTFITPIGGESSYHITKTIERNEHHVPQVPIVIPTQNSYTHEYEEEQRQIHRPQPRPQFYGINQQNHTSHKVETQQRIHNVEIVTPAPTITRQDVYDHFYESEVVPNYKPRVTIDQNTQFHELEVHNRQEYERPIVIPTATTRTHIEKEEEQIDRQYQQRPVYRPQITTHVETNEETEFNRQVTQKPAYIYPTQSTISRTENEEVQTIQHQTRPQYPIFSHTTNVKTVNENQNTNTKTIYQQPYGGGQTVTTIKESHYVNVLPQPANQYTYQYTEEEYNERLNRIQQELRRLGYGTLTEDEYNATIASGGFIHNGYKYLYNTDRGRYEKTEKIEINEEEYHSLLRSLQSQLQQLGLQMTENEYNQTIEDGYFTQNGVRYVFDSETRAYHRQDVSDQQYNALRQQILDVSSRHGWTLTEHEINQTIATGYLNINGHRYHLDKQTGVLMEGQEVQISEQEYRTILRRLQDQLARLGFEQMTEKEYNQTINSGYFVRDGQKYRYNADIGRYEHVEISEEEYHKIVTKLKETLQRLNYRQMSEQEMNETIAKGTFIRGGYQWTYNTETGEANAVRVASAFEELSETEYQSIYRRLQALIKKLGFSRMSETECSNAITRGSFSRGGNQWVYQPASGEFERIELTESEYNFRINRLLDILRTLGIEKTTNEQRDIIYRGNFYHDGHRYEYDTTSGSFVQVQMTEDEYQERKRQLLEQLQQIGYGHTMTDSECRKTISSGIFYYGGHEWVYSYQSGRYEMGKVSDKESGIVDDNYFNTIDLDSTHYESSKKDDITPTEAFDIDKVDKHKRPKEIISKNRGDQPPQTFEEDYDESIEVTQRPIQPTTQRSRPPPPPPQPLPQITTPTPFVVSTVSSDYNRRVENQRIVQYTVPPPETEYEQRYHHKKTTYTQRSGLIPVNQEILSRARKSGDTGFEANETSSPENQIEVTKTNIVQPMEQQKIGKLEEAPIELNTDEKPTRTRFSGRKSLSAFFDSTTQIINTKKSPELASDFLIRSKEKSRN
ncbi:uncharacterized protein LOC116343550 [Contarinia nasturtii]|uniref:uncharacterized protein LOC116343550 n=1 Tax=Contarinia nasturtii TaxID=265458 RepID=UPI0012D42B3A|nr:uncharacterized protein LOC116343550 [Contarinia nasturtii]